MVKNWQHLLCWCARRLSDQPGIHASCQLSTSGPHPFSPRPTSQPFVLERRSDKVELKKKRKFISMALFVQRGERDFPPVHSASQGGPFYITP